MSITARDGEKGGLGGAGLGCKGDSVHGRESTDGGPRGLGLGVIVNPCGFHPEPLCVQTGVQICAAHMDTHRNIGMYTHTNIPPPPDAQSCHAQTCHAQTCVLRPRSQAEGAVETWSAGEGEPTGGGE